jgi:hypothetical protein
LGDTVERVLPDTPRDEVVALAREMATLIERALPDTINVDWPLAFADIGALIMTRIAGQTRSVAILLERGLEIDARMIMRAALEHATLFAWLAIDRDELDSPRRASREWAARRPEDNARWWAADQVRRDQRLTEGLHVVFGTLDAEQRAAIRMARGMFKTELGWGPVPPIETMATEADACWGGTVPGWPNVSRGDPAYSLTLHGFYWILYQAGNTSAHPHLGALLAIFTAPQPQSTEALLTPERPGEKVDVIGSITVYLALYAIGVADHRLGWSSLGDGLRALGRFDDVMGPGQLLALVGAILEGAEGRRYGVAHGDLISIERTGNRTTFVTVSRDTWTTLQHEPGPVWTVQVEHNAPVIAGPLQLTGDVTQAIVSVRDRVAVADWLAPGITPEGWPTTEP